LLEENAFAKLHLLENFKTTPAELKLGIFSTQVRNPV